MGFLYSRRIKFVFAGVILPTYTYFLLIYIGFHCNHGPQHKSVKPAQSYASNENISETFPTSPKILDTYIHLLDWGFPLAGSLKSPTPSFTFGNVSGDTEFMIGIPTVERERGNYLVGTLKSLVENRRAKEGIFKIIIFIGDVNLTYVEKRSEQLYQEFENEFSSGRMQVISPPKHYYPDWDIAIKRTLKDSIDRVKWRSKENLDAVFIMMYIYQLSPKYYLMLEDDVLGRFGYDRTIIDSTKSLEKSEWFFISFCDWFSVGKLFKTEAIPSFAAFVHMFWNKKPLDWLQKAYTRAAYCREDANEKSCDMELQRKMPFFKPYVFKHVGK